METGERVGEKSFEFDTMTLLSPGASGSRLCRDSGSPATVTVAVAALAAHRASDLSSNYHDPVCAGRRRVAAAGEHINSGVNDVAKPHACVASVHPGTGDRCFDTCRYFQADPFRAVEWSSLILGASPARHVCPQDPK